MDIDTESWVSEIQLFLETILPQQGLYCVSTVSAGSKPDAGRFFKTIEGAAEALEAARRAGRQGYLAQCSFADRNAGRTIPNVLLCQNIFMDIDCGPDKEYPTKQEAVAALSAFLKATGFPRPTWIVNSGNGIHCHWTLTEALTEADWKPIAQAMKRFMLDNNFHVDKGVGAEACRYTRAPGTLNAKNKTDIKECQLALKTKGPLHTPDELRAILPAPDVAPIVSNVAHMFVGQEDALIRQVEYRKVYFANVVKECAVMKEALDTNGAKRLEPEWKADLRTLAACEDGAEYLHRISDGHPTYSEAETDKKFQESKDYVASDRGGPTRCRTYHEFFPKKCQRCPHWAGTQANPHQSPAGLGGPPADEEPPSALGYYLTNTATERVIKTLDGEAQEPIKICNYRLANLLVEQGDDDTFLTLDVGDKSVTFEQSLLADMKATTKELFKQNIILHENQRKGFVQLMSHWSEAIAKARKVRRRYEQFGWDSPDKSGLRSFAFSDTAYMPDGTEHIISPPDHEIARLMQPVGDEATWHLMAQAVVDSGSPELQVIMAASFAAPLFMFTGEEGAVLSAIGESGAGKSTALVIGMSAWVRPKEGTFRLNDTAVSIANITGKYNTLPVAWDEVRYDQTMNDGGKVVDLVYNITQGREKNRGTPGATIKRGGRWCTLLTTTSNIPMKQHIAAMDKSTNAGSYRVLEFEVPDGYRDSFDEKHKSLLAQRMEHSGHIGPQYARLLVKNQKLIQKRVKRTLASLVARTPTEARFLCSTVAVLLEGAALAKKAGFIDFDIDAMKRFLLRTLKANIQQSQGMLRDTNSDSNMVGAVKSFMERNSDCIVTSDTVKKRGRAAPPVFDPLSDSLMTRRKAPVLHIATKDQLIRIHKPAFMNYVRELNGSTKIVDDLLKLHGVHVIGKTRVVAGHEHFSTMPLRDLIEVPYNNDTSELFSDLLLDDEA